MDTCQVKAECERQGWKGENDFVLGRMCLDAKDRLSGVVDGR
jgi:hypothetical protein